MTYSFVPVLYCSVVFCDFIVLVYHYFILLFLFIVIVYRYVSLLFLFPVVGFDLVILFSTCLFLIPVLLVDFLSISCRFLPPVPITKKCN